VDVTHHARRVCALALGRALHMHLQMRAKRVPRPVAHSPAISA
jgi:hypothetical protein